MPTISTRRDSQRRQMARCACSPAAVGAAVHRSIRRSSGICRSFMQPHAPAMRGVCAGAVSRGTGAREPSLRTDAERGADLARALLGDVAERKHRALPSGSCSIAAAIPRALARHEPRFGTRLRRDGSGTPASLGAAAGITQRRRRVRALPMSRHAFTRMRVNQTSNGRSSR